MFGIVTNCKLRNNSTEFSILMKKEVIFKRTYVTIDVFFINLEIPFQNSFLVIEHRTSTTRGDFEEY